MRLVSSFLVAAAAIVLGADTAFAQEAAAAASNSYFLSTQAVSALAIAFAAIGGAMGQSRVVSSALESIGRNPGAAGQMFLPWILALAFIESLVIFTMVIVFQVLG